MQTLRFFVVVRYNSRIVNHLARDWEPRRACLFTCSLPTVGVHCSYFTNCLPLHYTCCSHNVLESISDMYHVQSRPQTEYVRRSTLGELSAPGSHLEGSEN